MGTYPKFEGVPVRAYDKMVADLQARARKELGLPDSELVTRPLRAEDLGLSTPQWTFTLTSTVGYVAMINTISILDNRYVGINGICYTNAAPAVNQLRITRAGSVSRVWNIQEVQYNENDSVWFDDPVTVGQNETLLIEQYASAATTQSAELIVFYGVTVEKRGIVTNP